jgi:hypothetical protein
MTDNDLLAIYTVDGEMKENRHCRIVFESRRGFMSCGYDADWIQALVDMIYHASILGISYDRMLGISYDRVLGISYDRVSLTHS